MFVIKKFGEVCEFVRGPFGGSLKKNCFVEDGYAVYEQQHAIYNQFTDIRYFVDEDKFNEMKRFELKPNDLIMSCSGTMGKVAIVPENIKQGIINQALLKLTPKEILYIYYLEYWMRSPDFDNRIKENTVGAAIKNVASVKVLKQIDVPIPPLSEQKQIVEILDEAFVAIDQAKANIEKNIQNAKELFQSKREDIFEKLSQENEVKPIAESCDKIFAGGDKPKEHFSKEKTEENQIPILSNGEKNMGLYGYTNEARVDKPSITVSARGTIGYTVFRDYPFVPIVRLIVLTPKTDIIEPQYLMYCIKNLDILKSGSSIPQLTVPMIKTYSIPVPTLEEQIDVVKMLNNLHLKIEEYKSHSEKKLNELDDLKKSILQKAFAGELTNKKVEV